MARYRLIERFEQETLSFRVDLLGETSAGKTNQYFFFFVHAPGGARGERAHSESL